MPEQPLIENPDDINLRRGKEVDESLGSLPHSILSFGPAVVLGLLVLLLGLSWFVKYPDVLPAEAVITTRIPPQKEYARVSGKIDTLFVANNEEVPAGTPLAVLENTADWRAVFKLKTAVAAMAVHPDSLYFSFGTVSRFSLGEIETAFSAFENAYTQYRLNAKLRPFSNESAANRLTLAELDDRLQSLYVQNDLLQTEVTLKQKDLERYKALLDKGVISSQEYETRQVAFYQAQRNFRNNALAISQLRENRNTLRKDSRGIEIDRTREETQLFNGTVQAFNLLKKAIRDWEQAYLLRANIGGKVSFLHYWTKNQEVRAGDLLFTIIPSENSPFVARLKVPVERSGKLRSGQKVTFQLANYPSYEFGMLKGTVETISLTPDEEGFYLVEVALPDTLVTTYRKKIPFRQEMKARARVITEDLRLMERVFYYFRQLVQNEG